MIFINQYIENRVSSITRVMDLDRKDMHYIYKPSNLLRILIFLNNIKTRSFPISQLINNSTTYLLYHEGHHRLQRTSDHLLNRDLKLTFSRYICHVFFIILTFYLSNAWKTFKMHILDQISVHFREILVYLFFLNHIDLALILRNLFIQVIEVQLSGQLHLFFNNLFSNSLIAACERSMNLFIHNQFLQFLSTHANLSSEGDICSLGHVLDPQYISIRFYFSRISSGIYKEHFDITNGSVKGSTDFDKQAIVILAMRSWEDDSLIGDALDHNKFNLLKTLI